MCLHLYSQLTEVKMNLHLTYQYNTYLSNKMIFLRIIDVLEVITRVTAVLVKGILPRIIE